MMMSHQTHLETLWKEQITSYFFKELTLYVEDQDEENEVHGIMKCPLHVSNVL